MHNCVIVLAQLGLFFSFFIIAKSKQKNELFRSQTRKQLSSRESAPVKYSFPFGKAKNDNATLGIQKN